MYCYSEFAEILDGQLNAPLVNGIGGNPNSLFAGFPQPALRGTVHCSIDCPSAAEVFFILSALCFPLTLGHTHCHHQPANIL